MSGKKQIDSTNKDELMAFFKENEGCSYYELAIIAGVSITTILHWKRKCGLTKTPYKIRKPKIPKDLIVTENWNSKEWFEKVYPKYGIKVISMAIKRPAKFVSQKLRQYGIEVLSQAERTKSTHPCCDEAWLYYYYADKEEYIKWCSKNNITPQPDGGKGWDLRRCSAEAGVNMNTILNWLITHKMKVRSKSEIIITPKELTPKQRRKYRDKYFELYRKGLVCLTIGSYTFNNGTLLDQKKALNSFFNKRIRTTPKHSQDKEDKK